jgi:hypothetical protein
MGGICEGRGEDRELCEMGFEFIVKYKIIDKM